MRASHDLKRRPFQLDGFQLRRKEAPRQALSRPSGVVNFAESNKMGMTAIIVEADEKSTRPVDDMLCKMEERSPAGSVSQATHTWANLISAPVLAPTGAGEI